MKPIVVTEQAASRFKTKYEKTETCWLWKGSLATNGYAQFSLPNGSKSGLAVQAHRFAWIAENGPIPDGLFVLHRCDVRNCVNPAHLFLGTLSDNVQDAIAKGRAVNGSKPRTHCKRGHALTPENVYISRDGRRNETRRACRICKIAADRNRRAIVRALKEKA